MAVARLLGRHQRDGVVGGGHLGVQRRRPELQRDRTRIAGVRDRERARQRVVGVQPQPTQVPGDEGGPGCVGHRLGAARAVVRRVGQRGDRLLAAAHPLLAVDDRQQPAVEVEVGELLAEAVDGGMVTAPGDQRDRGQRRSGVGADRQRRPVGGPGRDGHGPAGGLVLRTAGEGAGEDDALGGLLDAVQGLVGQAVVVLHRRPEVAAMLLPGDRPPAAGHERVVGLGRPDGPPGGLDPHPARGRHDGHRADLPGAGGAVGHLQRPGHDGVEDVDRDARAGGCGGGRPEARGDRDGQGGDEESAHAHVPRR